MFFNFLIKPKKILMVIAIVTLMIVVATIINILINVKQIKEGIKIDYDGALEFNNYYTEYDMTVVSNKNTNTYNVKEWHKNGNYTKIEYLDYMKNKVSILLENNICHIENSGNIAKMVVENTHNNKNISSLSTFTYLYNLVNNNCECKKEAYKKDDENIIKVRFSKSCSCEAAEFANNLKLAILELVVVNNEIKNYIIYDENKEVVISIVYNKFEKIT